MAIGSAGSQAERCAPPPAIDDQMQFRARLATACLMRPGLRAPLFALMDALSSEARLRSGRSASRSHRVIATGAAREPPSAAPIAPPQLSATCAIDELCMIRTVVGRLVIGQIVAARGVSHCLATLT
jgi:hypothetical protein